MYFWIHLVLAVLLTAYYLWRFLKDRSIYQILFVCWVPMTLLTYIPILGQNTICRIVLGVLQLVMFLLVIFFMFRKEPKKDPSPEISSLSTESESHAEEDSIPSDTSLSKAKEQETPETDSTEIESSSNSTL